MKHGERNKRNSRVRIHQYRSVLSECNTVRAIPTARCRATTVALVRRYRCSVQPDIGDDTQYSTAVGTWLVVSVLNALFVFLRKHLPELLYFFVASNRLVNSVIQELE